MNPIEVGETLRTRIGGQSTNELWNLSSWKEVWDFAKKTLRYGEAFEMEQECLTRAGTPPLRYRKFRSIPFPWFAAIVVAALLILPFTDLLADLVVVAVVAAFGGMLVLTTFMVENEHDQTGKCYMCGQPACPQYPGPITLYSDYARLRGRHNITRSGWCAYHASASHKYWLWHRARLKLWYTYIVNEPLNQPTFYQRRIAYPLRLQLQRYRDDRVAIGGTYNYTVKDREDPGDKIDHLLIRGLRDDLQRMDADLARLEGRFN